MPHGLTTGQMTRASGLSTKALRLYDANGLLVPARVDPVTGYRTYDAAQVARARAIGLLRRLDLPLARVAELLDGPPQELRPALLAWWAQRARALAEQRDLVDLVGVGPSEGDPAGAGPDIWTDPGTDAGPRPEVRREVRHERVLATRTDVVDQRDLVPTFTAAVLSLRAELASQGAGFGAEYWVVYHDDVLPGVPGRIETCVPYDGPVRPVGAMVLRVEPAQEVAVVGVPAADCRYPAILAYYRAVHGVARGWVGDGPRTPGAPRTPGTPRTGPAREVYPVPWSHDAVEVARIEIPLGSASIGARP